MSNIVFTYGAITDIKKDQLRVYYGGADTCIAPATGKISRIIEMCR
jgi:predicted GH43/DUF377 family glycosyl hydrolase